MCKTCNDKKFIFVPCPLCSDEFDCATMMEKKLGIRCDECRHIGGGGKVPVECPDCNSDNISELPIHLL